MDRYVTKEDGGPWIVLDTHQLTEERLVAGPMSKGDAACVVRELNYLQSTIAALNTDVSNLTQALENAKSDPESGHARLTERVNTLAAENMVLKTQQETAQHSIRRLGHDNTALRNREAEYKQHIEDLRTQKAELANSLAERTLDEFKETLIAYMVHNELIVANSEDPLQDTIEAIGSLMLDHSYGPEESKDGSPAEFNVWEAGFEAGVEITKREAHRAALAESRAYDDSAMSKREIFLHQGACHRVAARISKISKLEEQ